MTAVIEIWPYHFLIINLVDLYYFVCARIWKKEEKESILFYLFLFNSNALMVKEMFRLRKKLKIWLIEIIWFTCFA